MADDSIQVTIGADASGFVQGSEKARNEIDRIIQALALLQRTMGVAARVSTQEMVAAVDRLSGRMSSGTAQANTYAQAVSRASQAAHSGGGGGHGGGGWGSVIVEARALFDELSSGRAHQAIGTFTRFETFLGRINPMFAVASLGAIAFGAALFETAKYFADPNNTASQIRQSAAFSGNFSFVDPKALDEAAAKLRDLKTIWNSLGLSDKGFSEEEIAKVTSSFAQMGDTSNDTIRGMALAMSTMWQQFGTDEKDAAKNIVEVFSKPLAPIDEIAKHLHGLTDEERARLKAAQDTESPLLAQAEILEILSQRERNATAAKAQGLRDQIAAQQQVVDQISLQDGASSALLHDQTDYLNSLKDQLATLDKIGDSLQSQADKMRSMLEPAQNIANAMRDWTKKADPKAASAENVDEEIAKGEAALKRMRNAAASSGGESPFGGLINSDDYAKASAALDALKAKRDATFEKDSRKDVDLENLRSQADGRANAVNEAQRLHDESADYLSRMNRPASTTGEQADLYREAQQRALEDEKSLAAAKRAFAESQLALEVANAGTNYQTRYAAEVKLNAIKRQDANGDPSKLNEVAAERAKLDQAYQDEQARRAASALDNEIAQVRDTAQQKVKVYQDDVRQRTITAQQGADAERTVLLSLESDLEALYARKRALYSDDANKQDEVEKSKLAAIRAIDDQIVQEQRQAADATAKGWETGGQEILSAWNSNLRDLLSGSKNFATAMRETVADLVLQLIEAFEKFAVSAVLQYAFINHAAGASAAIQTAANESAAAGGLSALVGNAVKAITIDAGQTFAGVAAWGAPLLGPAALGPAAAAQAAVLGAAAFDIGAWNVPHDQLALIHRNELVATPSQAEAIRAIPGALARSGGDGAGGQGGTNVSLSPQTHFHVNAIDGASVGQFFRNNQSGMMRAINQAVRDGAHHSLRRIGTA